MTTRLRWQVVVSLKDFQRWSTPGVGELLRELLDARPPHNRDLLGHAISRFVQATDSGDELLWEWITCDFEMPKFPGLRHRVELHCLPHEVCSDSFLRDRACESERLLDLILSSVLRWSREIADEREVHTFYNAFLHDTSWELNHNTGRVTHPDSATVLFNAVEFALSKHAKDNSLWWRKHAEELRCSPELAFRYLYVRACESNIKDNAHSIAALLVDRDLLDCGDLDYELGRLLNAACPYVSLEVVEETQRIILQQYNDDLNSSSGLLRRSVIHRACTWLNWIPCCFRLPEGQDLLDRHAHPLFPLDRKPTVYLSGGMVQPPFTTEQLLGLSDSLIIRLLNHYSGPGDHEDFCFSLTGGTGQVLDQLRNAASLDPSRLLKLLPRIAKELPDARFFEQVLTGLAYHIESRNGRMTQPKWAPFSVPDLTDLARSLLQCLQHLPAQQNSRAVAEVLLACAGTLLGPNDVELLTTWLCDVLKRDDADEGIEETDGLITTAINSTRGREAEAALILCNRLLENGRPLPESLPTLLHQMSTDSSVAVRALILTHLAYTQIKAPELGWALFREAIGRFEPHLWSHTERCLYHQYHDHYDRVAPWLDRIEAEGPADADAWLGTNCYTCMSFRAYRFHYTLDQIGDKGLIKGVARRNAGLCCESRPP